MPRTDNFDDDGDDYDDNVTYDLYFLKAFKRRQVWINIFVRRIVFKTFKIHSI